MSSGAGANSGDHIQPFFEGRLSKWTNYVHGWQFRWFVLSHGVLSYYSSKEKMSLSKHMRGSINLTKSDISIDLSNDLEFTITCSPKIFYLKASSVEERKQWLTVLNEAKNGGECETPPKSTGEKAMLNINPKQLHNKYVEACMYRTLSKQHLDNLFEYLKNRNQATSSGAGGSEQDSWEDGRGSVERAAVRASSSEGVPTNNGEKDSLVIFNATSDALFKTIDDCLHSLKLAVELVGTSDGSTIEQGKMSKPLSPEVLLRDQNKESYSESKDSLHAASGVTQDIFFDAVENYEDLNDGIYAESGEELLSDEESGEDVDSDDEGDSGQRSVLYHLISSVKIGTDLTKVPLPTFILERKSLLEMYSDFMAHADMFLKIPDFDDPRERFLQVLRWHLCSFAEGRKSSIAKKPYNPILGEIFRCSWDLQNENLGHVFYVSEQVSHHPPVSAFYFESKKKRIVCNAHIWTKSKFYGLSIGVHNVGQASIQLLDRDEEYILTFPSAYGRSILNVPWVELGGKTSLICKKTGYRADIEFLCKPTFGGKPHKISCEVKHVTKPKSILKVTGEWNGTLTFNDLNTTEQEVVNLKSLPVIPKIVKPLKEQEPYESRRLWKDVTRALKYKEMDKATAGKHKLEEKQRADAKYRQQNNVVYKQKIFSKDTDGNWRYNDSLV
eukprot:Nk52_evm59s914 gene=Nk52_evmTU59s914